MVSSPDAWRRRPRSGRSRPWRPQRGGRTGRGAADVADEAVVGYAALGTCGGGRIVGRGARCLAPIQVRADRVVAELGEPAGDLLRRPVVARHVVDHDDAAARPAALGGGEVGLDLVL